MFGSGCGGRGQLSYLPALPRHLRLLPPQLLRRPLLLVQRLLKLSQLLLGEKGVLVRGLGGKRGFFVLAGR